MLLQRIEVENFRGLRQARLEFDGTTVLIGENSAGKTTLLDAIAICLSGRDDIVRLEVRDFHQDGGNASGRAPAHRADVLRRGRALDGCRGGRRSVGMPARPPVDGAVFVSK